MRRGAGLVHVCQGADKFLDKDFASVCAFENESNVYVHDSDASRVYDLYVYFSVYERAWHLFTS